MSHDVALLHTANQANAQECRQVANRADTQLEHMVQVLTGCIWLIHQRCRMVETKTPRWLMPACED
jgi:hypothetical protein